MKIAMLGLKSIPVGEYGGGIERHVEELAERLVRRGHTVFVYVRSYAMKGKKTRTWRGVHLIPLPTIRRKNLETIVHTFLATIHVLFMRVHVIHYHGVGPATFAWIPRILKPWARVIVTFHAIDRFQKKWGAFARFYLGFGEWAAMHFPHRTIVVSHVLQVYTHRRYKKPALYIPNGVELRTIRKTDALIPFHLRAQNYFLMVARLVKHKGIHYLIQAFRSIKTDKKLVIVGAPSFTEDYVEYLAKLAADDPRIIFTGYQTGEILAQLFAHTYLYTHASEMEGLSLSILDAMSYGAPVLVANIPENIEVIDHSGFSFENRNVHDLRKKMMYALANPDAVRAMARRGKNFVKTVFSWDAIVRETEKVYGTRMRTKRG